MGVLYSSGVRVFVNVYYRGMSMRFELTPPTHPPTHPNSPWVIDGDDMTPRLKVLGVLSALGAGDDINLADRNGNTPM